MVSEEQLKRIEALQEELNSILTEGEGSSLEGVDSDSSGEGVEEGGVIPEVGIEGFGESTSVGESTLEGVEEGEGSPVDSGVDSGVSSVGVEEGDSDVVGDYTDFVDEDPLVDSGVDNDSLDSIVERLGVYAPAPKKKGLWVKYREGVKAKEGEEEEEVEEEVEERVLGENVFLESRVPQEVVVKKNEEVLGDGSEYSDSLSWEFLEPEGEEDIPYLLFSSEGEPVLGVALTKRATEELSAALQRAHRFYVPAPQKKLKWNERVVKWYKGMLKKHGVVTTLGSGVMGLIALFMVGMFVYTSFMNSKLGMFLFGG